MKRTLFVTFLLAILTLTACDTYLTTITCDCSGNFFDCADFATQAEAQDCYEYCLDVVGRDIHRLDGDNNGLVCEAVFDLPPTAPAEPPTAPAAGDITFDEVGFVGNVVDGDTIDVTVGGQEFRVRYIGVNTPERDEPCYTEATQANAALVSGQTAYLVRDVSNTDRFDRLLRYIYVEENGGGFLFVNAELVAQGYAEAVAFEPDIAHFSLFQSLEAEAEAAGLGCHSTGAFED